MATTTAQRDEEKRAAEAAAAAAEAPGAITEYRADPDKIEVDREIRVHLVANRLQVPQADSRFRYRWERAWDRNDRYDGYGVETRKSTLVKINGVPTPAWEIVLHGTHRDAEGLPRTPEGYCRIGDCLLMRCRADVYAALERAAEADARDFAGIKDLDLQQRLAHEGRGQVMVRDVASSSDVSRQQAFAR